MSRTLVQPCAQAMRLLNLGTHSISHALFGPRLCGIPKDFVYFDPPAALPCCVRRSDDAVELFQVVGAGGPGQLNSFISRVRL